MRILILGPWPVATPLHGGQVRAGRIVEAYRAAGHVVLFAGVYDPASPQPADHSEDDHPITPAIHAQTMRFAGTPNMGFWQALADEPASFARFRSHLAAFAPDVVQFEEPFLWPVVGRLAEAGALRSRGGERRVRVLHSSYNIEHAWRREHREGATAQEDAFLLELERMEAEIARSADAVAVVSDADAAAFRAMGADHVVVAANGTAFAPPSEAGRRTVRQYLNRQPYALFVSSGHPPNATGFMQQVRGAPGTRLQNGILAVCGEVGRLLHPHAAEPGLQHLFRDIRLLGRVPADLLAALYEQAHAVMLPRTHGGGSNLKTAEALAAGRPIVGTSRAFIGFEDFAGAPGTQIADEPAAFWSALDALLGAPRSDFVARDGIDRLAWPHTLAPMLRAVEALG